MGKLSRQRGASYEREVAKALHKMFPKARRHLEYHALDANGVDLQDTGPFAIQCKRGRTYAPINKIKEVQCSPDMIPMLVTRADNEESLVVLSLENFIKILGGGVV